MKIVIFSPSTLRIFSAFLTDVAAAVFLGIFPSTSPVELTERIVAVILCLYAATVFDRGEFLYDNS
jgi:hypothetical protein